MKWSHVKWIIIAALIIVAVYLYYRYTVTEGFLTMSNITYPFKEVFLVAPNVNSENGSLIQTYTVPTAAQYTSQGYTWTQAQKLCQEKYNGDLATLEQVQKAYDNSGNWCIAGWVSGSSGPSGPSGIDYKSRAYYLPNLTNSCGLTPTGTPPRLPSTLSYITPAVDANGNNRAFPICYAVKPGESNRLIKPFNNVDYSMISADLLSKVMNGDGSDIFSIPFTSSQAYYALDTNGTDTNNKFSFRMARDWLIANYDNANPTQTVDALILNAIKETDNPAQWSNLNAVNYASCGLIEEKDNYVSDKVITLQTAFRDVSGYVLATIKSKTENARIQGMLYNICSGTTPDASPSCAKLATLDFDLFYTNPTHSTLSDLEILNRQIFARREEICQILHNIRIIKSTLGCTYIPRTPECSEGCIIKSATSGPSGSAAVFDCSNSTIFDFNNIGGLRYSLEQLSPLFDAPKYKTLLADVMTKLSYIVETPSLASFETTDNNIRLINTAIKDISDLVTLTGGQ
jgi:hypothetical protein